MPSEQERRRPRRRPKPKTEQPPKVHHPLRTLILIIIGLVFLGEGIYLLTRDKEPVPTGPNTLTQVEQKQPVDSDVAPKTVIHIAAAGDVNVTDKVIDQNAALGGGYDFTPAFLEVVPALSDADLTIVNLEGNFCGEPYGTASGSAPRELADALAQAGVDVVQTANSFSIRNGLLGLQDTLNTLHAAGLQTVGTSASQEGKSAGSFLIREVGGIRVALVAFTKGMDNLGLPEGSEGAVNLLYKDYATTYQEVDYDGIRQVLRSVEKAQPDYTIALLHWGSEYNDEISDSQNSIRNLLFGNGVDAIIGTHPHLVQQIDYDQEAGTFIAYSLGDFYGDGEESGSGYSMILNLEITRDNVTGETKLTDYTYTPTFLIKPDGESRERLRVTDMNRAMALHESGFAGSVSQDVFDNMEFAAGRLKSRIGTE